MPQLQINQGPQDALLYDNSRSYFTNVGYLRTSNFQMELRDLDAQNNASLGATVQFIVPKAADLLGPVDLMIDFNKAETASIGTTAWVETVGFAMIEKIVFSVGSHDVETITGDQLNIMNELMQTSGKRLDNCVGKFGYPSSVYVPHKASNNSEAHPKTLLESPRVIANVTSDPNTKQPVETTLKDGMSLTIPLGLFFTKHPSQFFPIAAIAGCNEIRISVKLRNLNEIVQLRGEPTYKDSYATENNANDISPAVLKADLPLSEMRLPTFETGNAIQKCRLRCHYVHVTGPEATTLMNKEHVRLLKLWQVNTTTVSRNHKKDGTKIDISMDLSFLHPVQELIITIRKVQETGSSVNSKIKITDAEHGAVTKNHFAYQGGNTDPNVDSLKKGYLSSDPRQEVTESYLKIENFGLTLNGQERHPSLASTGLERDYMMNRLLPGLHSSGTDTFSRDVVASGQSKYSAIRDMLNGPKYNTQSAEVANALTTASYYEERLSEMNDRKEIYVYPFSLNPEGSNPSGAVNFSKVSHAKLHISGMGFCKSFEIPDPADQVNGVSYPNEIDTTNVEYQVDVYGVHYNWLQIKDGRALTSFA
jgi:hypothetical protein